MIFNRRPWACLLLMCCGRFVLADPPANPLDPPQGLFSDEWMELELNSEVAGEALKELTGGKVGYTHATMTREGDVVTSRTLTYFKLGRAERNVEITVRQTTRETVAGEPLEFESETKMAMIEMKTSGKIEAGKVHLTSSQFGVANNQVLDFPTGAKMQWGIFREGIARGFAPGTRYDLDIYEPTMRPDAAIKSRTVVGERVSIDLRGAKREAIKVITTLLLQPGAVDAGIDSVGYVDDAGRVLRAEVNLSGFAVVAMATDAKTALAEFKPPEIFMDTLIRVDRAIDRDSASRIRYKLSVAGPNRRIPPIPETDMQKPGDRTEQSVTLEVRRINHHALRDVAALSTHAALAEYLESTPVLNIDDDAIRKMAAEAAAEEKRPYYLADKLRVYVSDIIKEKNLNIGFATAGEVCRQREGDCSEHAVLLAALGRARGIPSRIVVGLAYVPSFNGQKDVFGFHMWTQFHLGEQWVDFDAALRESDCSPARIALSTSSLKTGALGDLAFAILDVITGLKIDLESVESR